MRGAIAAVIVVLLGAVLMAAGVLVLSFVDRVVPSDEAWYIVVRVPEGENATLGIEELQVLGSTTVRIALLGTGEDGQPHSYMGLLIRDLAAELNVTSYSTVTVRAVDTYSKKLTRDQVEDHDVLLAFRKDGKDLAPRSEGGTGPVRLVLPQGAVGTYNAQHCVKWVSEVVFE